MRFILTTLALATYAIAANEETPLRQDGDHEMIGIDSRRIIQSENTGIETGLPSSRYDSNLNLPFRNINARPSVDVDEDLAANLTDNPELLGNNNLIFSSPFLEWYSSHSATSWHVIGHFIPFAQFFIKSGATGLMTYSQFAYEDQTLYAEYALQLGLVANALDMIEVFIDKVVIVRENQALTYAKMNKELEERERNPQSVYFINNKPASEYQIFFSPFLENFYSNSAVWQNVLWDNVGVWSIISASLAYSLIGWSSIESNPQVQRQYILAGTLLSFASAALALLAKKLKVEVTDTETKVSNLRAYRLDQRRIAMMQAPSQV